ncbi:MAG: class I SAM-dependent methyltransferase [Candidatus Thorarchaeota archaeon]|nr:class I SAM-dependent methyltransferase [Candidatus Thorarchaeota archaeon]
METVESGWDDFWAEVMRVKYRSSVQGIAQYDDMLVECCIQLLALKRGDAILDIACGAGDHSLLFCRHGLEVTGFDISKTLIKTAQQRALQQSLDVDFHVGDMRVMKLKRKYNGAAILSHSFGFFDDEVNRRILERVHDSLLEGGGLLIDLMNPYNLPRFHPTWTKLEGGYLLTEPYVLDAQAGVLRGRPAVFIDTDRDRVILMNSDAMSNNDIRMYTALEIRSLLEDAGFIRIDMYGQNKLPRVPYSASSERMVVVAFR